ncbi:MAG: hypothetical protein QW818_03325 [Candidatus Aenigmatarchaeota archaeon]
MNFYKNKILEKSETFKYLLCTRDITGEILMESEWDEDEYSDEEFSDDEDAFWGEEPEDI